MQKIAGRVLLDLLPAMSHPLLAAHWTSGGTRLKGMRQRLFRLAADELDARYYDPPTPTAERERLKSICMAGESAVAWAEHYLALGFPEKHTGVIGMFHGLEAALKLGAVSSVHQVACCSGREIAYYARRYPEVAFIGSDCDQALIEFLGERWKDIPNLKFELLRMESPPSKFTCDLLYASGGLHYMDQDSLARFLAWARSHCSHLLLSQPMHRSYDPTKAAPSNARGMLSWNHPYPVLLQKSGWKAVGWKEGFVAEITVVKNFSAFAASKKEAFWPADISTMG